MSVTNIPPWAKVPLRDKGISSRRVEELRILEERADYKAALAFTKDNNVVLVETRVYTEPLPVRGGEKRAPPQRGRVAVTELEGVGPEHEESLRRAGVETVYDLLTRSPRVIARRSGVDERLIERWQDLGGLMQVRGLGPQYAELLVHVGVRTGEDLANANPDQLTEELLDVAPRSRIGENRVQKWVESAKQVVS